MDMIHDILSALKDRPAKKAVLATIIHVEGSSYRKEGTSMIMFEDRVSVGVLSAGCLEADLLERSMQLLDRNQVSQLLNYDLRSEDDLSWGRGAGCNGKIQVMLESIDERFREQLLNLRDHLGDGVPVLSFKKIPHDRSVFIPYEYAKEYRSWRATDSCDFFECIDNPVPFKGYSVLVEKNEDHPVFRQLYWPKPRLFIVGAGMDAQPLATMADTAGFKVSVIDWREGLCVQGNFPSVATFQIGRLETVLNQRIWTPLDAVMVMTHQFEKDKTALKRLLNEELLYLGVLGPKSRTARLLENRTPPARLDSPAGLNIGAEGPEEIAVSIVGQLIHRMRKFEEKINEK